MRKKTQRQLVEVVAESFSLANRRVVEESPHFYALVGLGSAARAYRQNAKIGRPLLLQALQELDEVLGCNAETTAEFLQALQELDEVLGFNAETTAE